MPDWTPTWIQAVVGLTVITVALVLFYKKLLSPAANLITTAEKGAPLFKQIIDQAPLFREIVEQFGDMPEALGTLREIAAQFHTDSGTTLRDVINRLEAAATDSRNAIAALTLVEADSARHLSTGQQAERMLAQEDRVQIATLLAELRRVNSKVDDAAAGRVIVAAELEAAHQRAEEHDAKALPGEASDAAMRRPDDP